MPERVIPLSGATNFRDFGGYPTDDGRRVRWRRLFRSNKLSQLTRDDISVVSGLSLATVVDLRTISEQKAEPSRWDIAPPDIYGSAKPDNSAVVELILGGVETEEDARQGMARFYRELPDRYEDEYRSLFQRLASEGPLLVHCTAGKDRTGVACALVLSALGVPRDLIIEDYAMTENLLHAMRQAESRSATPIGTSHTASILARYPREIRKVLWGSAPLFINAAFDSLEKNYGSVNGYLTNKLGVAPDDLARLRDVYCEA